MVLKTHTLTIFIFNVKNRDYVFAIVLKNYTIAFFRQIIRNLNRCDIFNVNHNRSANIEKINSIILR